MIDSIREIQKDFDAKTLCGLSYIVNVENNEIKFSYTIWRGFDLVGSLDGLYNACDWETNKKGILNAIEELKTILNNIIEDEKK
jgi:hypothetical protein